MPVPPAPLSMIIKKGLVPLSLGQRFKYNHWTIDRYDCKSCEFEFVQIFLKKIARTTYKATIEAFIVVRINGSLTVYNRSYVVL